MYCEICGVRTYNPFHQCTPSRIERLERAYAREEAAVEEYDAGLGNDPLQDGFLMLGLTEGEGYGD